MELINRNNKLILISGATTSVNQNINNMQILDAPESMSDNSQILENILPAFNPALHLRVKEFSFLNIERNMKVQLGDVSYDYPQEMSEEDSRYINSTMTFTVDGYMYRPVSQDYIIKYIKTNYWYNNDVSHAEVYSTSGMDLSATPPSDYTYGRLLGE
jgi:hypothetical protein